MGIRARPAPHPPARPRDTGPGLTWQGLRQQGGKGELKGKDRAASSPRLHLLLGIPGLCRRCEINRLCWLGRPGDTRLRVHIANSAFHLGSKSLEHSKWNTVQVSTALPAAASYILSAPLHLLCQPTFQTPFK